MKIGAFSLSLSVKDLAKSREFYEKIGFEVFMDASVNKYIIMKNEDVVIGLFEGMFEGNIMTFNPGWDNSAKDVDPFIDIRELEQNYKDSGIEFLSETVEGGEGPDSFTIEDPDGNIILVDQHR